MENDSLRTVVGSFHRAEVERYEAEVKQFRDSDVRLTELRKRREAQLREQLVASSVDVGRLDQTEKQAREELAYFLKETRPALADREVGDPYRSLEKARLIDACGPNRQALGVAAATLLAPAADFLEGNPGERGNPWVLPWNPGRVRISQSSTGDGWGCWAHGIQPATEAIFWYVFTPDRRSTWTLWPFTSLDGFYLMRADDGAFTCKYADVEVRIEMDVYQYFWHGARQDTLLNRHNQNISVGLRFDRSHYFDYRTALAPGSGAWEDNAFVRVKVSAQADTSGGGSYAEVNFAAGSANYIEPIVLIAFPG
jgi:hypothetical protein